MHSYPLQDNALAAAKSIATWIARDEINDHNTFSAKQEILIL
jgi:hypothetical protein